MRTTLTADEAMIYGDEDGWRLVISTDEGDRFTFRIQGIAPELASVVDQTIGAWLAERDEAFSTRVPPIDLDAYPPGSIKRIALEQEIGK